MIKVFTITTTFVAIASTILFALTPVASSQSSESFIVRHDTITSNSIAISWTLPTAGTPLYYTITVLNLVDMTRTTPVVQPPNRSHTITGLLPSTLYRIDIEADYSDASIGFSNSINVSTLSEGSTTPTDTAPTFGAHAIPNQTYFVGTPVSLNLPEATGGNDDILYTLQLNGTPIADGADIGGSTTTGLIYNATARTITGTPTATLSLRSYNWDAADSDENTALTDIGRLGFSVKILNPNPTSIVLSVTPATVVESSPIRNLTLTATLVGGAFTTSKTITYQSAGGTATATTDYTPIGATNLVIPLGQVSASAIISFKSFADIFDEQDGETVLITGTLVGDNTFTVTPATITIVENALSDFISQGYDVTLSSTTGSSSITLNLLVSGGTNLTYVLKPSNVAESEGTLVAGTASSITTDASLGTYEIEVYDNNRLIAYQEFTLVTGTIQCLLPNTINSESTCVALVKQDPPNITFTGKTTYTTGETLSNQFFIPIDNTGDRIWSVTGQPAGTTINHLTGVIGSPLGSDSVGRYTVSLFINYTSEINGRITNEIASYTFRLVVNNTSSLDFGGDDSVTSNDGLILYLVASGVNASALAIFVDGPGTTSEKIDRLTALENRLETDTTLDLGGDENVTSNDGLILYLVASGVNASALAIFVDGPGTTSEKIDRLAALQTRIETENGGS